jgi:hypothetical protein
MNRPGVGPRFYVGLAWGVPGGLLGWAGVIWLVRRLLGV